MSEPLAIIPARVGSKGIPGKNWKPLAGETPVHRAVLCAEAAGIDWVMTTDKPEAKYWTGEHYLYAPAPLHTDTCSMVDVVLDVLKRVPGDPDQKVLLVQPTQPLRKPHHLRQALHMLDDWDSMASVIEVEPAAKLYYWDFWPVTEKATERRQDGKRTFACDGTVYGFRREFFLYHRSFRECMNTGMLPLQPHETCKLDTPFDWEMAELRLRHQQGSRASSSSSPSDAEREYARSLDQALREIRRIADQGIAAVRPSDDSFGCQ